MPLNTQTTQTKQTEHLAEEPIPPLPRRPSLSLNPLLLEDPRQINLARARGNINRCRALNRSSLPHLEHNVKQDHHRSGEVRLEETQHLLADGHILVAHWPSTDPELRDEYEAVEDETDIRAYDARLRFEC